MHPFLRTLAWADLAPRYQALLDEPLAPAGVAAWLARWSDLEKLVWDTRAGYKRARSEDASAENTAAYANFTTNVFTPAQDAGQRLKRRLLDLAGWRPGPDTAQMIRRWRLEAGLGQPAPELAARFAELEGRCLQLAAGLEAELDGGRVTLQQAQSRLQSPDRAERERAWRSIQAAWDACGPEFDRLFVELVRERRRAARQLGAADYREYCWRILGRLDYTPDQCLGFHEVLERQITPVTGRWLARRRAALGLAELRPWDLQVNPDAGPALRPFAEAAQLEAGVARLLDRLDPAIGACFADLRDGWLDLAARPGKLPGSEEWLFPLVNRAYVRTNAVGTADDVLGLLHESGHALHDTLSAAHQPLFWNIGSGIEFSEFAAIGLATLALPLLEDSGLFSPAEADRARAAYLESIFAYWLPHIAAVDAFQHWLYVDMPEDAGPEQLGRQWAACAARFMPGVDWGGMEGAERGRWRQVQLLVSQPFYFIEYAIAHLAALRLWRNAGQDHAAALVAYRAALALGDTLPLAELFAAAGVRLPFAEAEVREIAEFMAGEPGRGAGG